MRILPKDPKTARQTPLFCLKSKAIVGLPYLKVCEPLSVFAGFVHQNFDFWQKVAFFPAHVTPKTPFFDTKKIPRKKRPKNLELPAAQNKGPY